ncbi:hypothetical protein Lpp27_10881 [Lacticaseibacillus paracasei subsp. paracasei CNCM I-4648]|nr:hypothetical protein Lpp27_10881 [Lacticaseibacillus paracasei subsp. paracasei CNCM I-4648]
MSTTGKIAAIIDDHRIAIKVDPKLVENGAVSVGDKVWIISKTVDIPDPDDEKKNLGSFTDYKDHLEVTSVTPKYIIATKYVNSGSALTISISGKKELGALDTGFFTDQQILSKEDKVIHIGDLVEFEQ